MLTIVFTSLFGPETQSQNLNAVMPTPRVYLIFWGSTWLQGNGPQNEQQLIYAVQQVLNSSFLQATAQYGTGGTASYGYSLTTNVTGEPANGFTTDTLYQIDYQLAHSGQLPNGNAVNPTPIFAIITPPGIQSNDPNAGGYNTNLTASGDSVDYPTIWCSSGNLDLSVPSAGRVNVDAFSKVFSHEMAECMTDLGQGGFEVNAGSTWPYTDDNGHQIGDYEPNGYQYREPNGAMVQALWSRADNKIIVNDGNTQDFILNAAAYGFHESNPPAQKYDLILNGDQPGHSDDIFYIDTISTPNGDEVKAVINSEVAVFEPGTIGSIVINPGGGSNTVYVANTDVPVTIFNNSPDTVKLGVGGSIRGIKANVTVATQANIEVDDSTDTTPATPKFAAGELDQLPGGARLLFGFGSYLTLDAGPGTSQIDVSDTIVDGAVTIKTVAGTGPVNVNKTDANGPLVVNLGGGTQYVNFSAVANDLSTTLFGDVTVNPGTGTSYLNIEDNNATVARHYTIDPGMVSTDIAGAGVIHFGRVSDIKLGDANRHNTITIQNTTSGLLTEVFGNSEDNIDVLGTALGSTVSLYGPYLNVNVGSSGRLTNLHGLLHVGGVGCTMTVDDSNDSSGQYNVAVRTTSITGLGDGAISYDNDSLQSTSIIGSGGGSTYQVLGVPAGGTNATTTLTCGGTDTVLVGDNGDLTGIQSNLVIHNPGKFTNLTIDASAQNELPLSHATITNSYVAGLALGEIQFDQSALSALTVSGPHGGASWYDIESLPSYFLFNLITTLNLAAGDTLNFGQNHSLQGAWGTGSLILGFSGSGGPTHVVLDGNQDPAGAAYTIGGNNNLTINNSTVGLGLTINGFRDQDQAVIDLPGGTVNADLTHTGPGTISLDGSARLLGTNVAAPLDATIHARNVAGTITPTGPITGLLRAFNSVYLIGSMPQDTLHVYDSNNQIAVANDPIQAAYAQFGAATGDPTTVTAGQPFDFTVIARDNTGAMLTTYSNQVQWYSYNGATGDYSSSNYEQFTPADQGQHTFHAIVLPAAGTYSLGFNDGWNASSFTITVVQAPQGGAGSEADGQGSPIAASGGSVTSSAANSSDQPNPSSSAANDAVASALSVVVPGATNDVCRDPASSPIPTSNSAVLVNSVPPPCTSAQRETAPEIGDSPSVAAAIQPPPVLQASSPSSAIGGFINRRESADSIAAASADRSTAIAKLATEAAPGVLSALAGPEQIRTAGVNASVAQSVKDASATDVAARCGTRAWQLSANAADTFFACLEDRLDLHSRKAKGTQRSPRPDSDPRDLDLIWGETANDSTSSVDGGDRPAIRKT